MSKSIAVVLALLAAAPAPAQRYAKLAPYPALRYAKDVPEVEHDGKWCELKAIDGVTAVKDFGMEGSSTEQFGVICTVRTAPG